MLSEQIFSKSLYEITFEDLQNFFTEEQDESAKLEFKTGQVSLDGLYKEICAFLNTEGGVIIVGSPREQKRKLVNHSEQTFYQGSLTPSKTLRNKDWLNHKIVSNISSAPSGIKIQDILTPEGNYFIIDVPQSMTPPHQCSGVYYIRMERDSMPAPHGIVEALFFKRQKPLLRLEVNIVNEDNKALKHVYLNLKIINDSPFPTEKVEYTITFINIKNLFPNEMSDENRINGDRDNRFTHNYSSETTLWKGIYLNFHYFILPLVADESKPFFFSISAWSRDAELKTMMHVYDSVSSAFLEQKDTTIMNDSEKKEYYTSLLALVSEK